MTSKEQVPLKENLWRDTGEGQRLMGSRCLNCGELFFPIKENGLCTQCQSKDLEEFVFSPRGTVYSCTCVMQRPPVYYHGDVPYAIGFVELPEGIRIETLFTDCDIEDVHVGMKVELVIEKLHEDAEGRDVMTYKFRPAN